VINGGYVRSSLSCGAGRDDAGRYLCASSPVFWYVARGAVGSSERQTTWRILQTPLLLLFYLQYRGSLRLRYQDASLRR